MMSCNSFQHVFMSCCVNAIVCVVHMVSIYLTMVCNACDTNDICPILYIMIHSIFVCRCDCVCDECEGLGETD